MSELKSGKDRRRVHWSQLGEFSGLVISVSVRYINLRVWSQNTMALKP